MRLLSLLFVPKCVSCGKRLPRSPEVALCPECTDKWIEERNAPCPLCGRDVSECWCGVRADVKHNVYAERHISNYSASRDSVSKKVVLSMKRRAYPPLYDQLAKELVPAVETFIEEPCSTVIVNIPRGKHSVRYFGFDQALVLSERVAAELEVPVAEAIVHTGNKKQKQLNVKARIENARKSFLLNNDLKPQIKGKRVILIDDVITTGASAARCAALLKRAGAERVYLVTVCRAY